MNELKVFQNSEFGELGVMLIEVTMIKCQLKSILKGLNLTQKELCERINARPSTICALCNNTFDYLNIHLLNDICDALNCDISELLKKAS